MPLTEVEKQTIKDKLLKNERKAYELAKYVRSISNREVSFELTNYYEIQNNNIIIHSRITEYPSIRVGHSLTDTSDSELLKDVDIDNIEGE